MPLQKYFPFLQEGIHWAFNHGKKLNWHIHIRDGWELHFSHFYCCSSTCPCITLRNRVACAVKWNHILHGAKRAQWIGNDHIICSQIESLKGIKGWPACVSYYAAWEKWRKEPILRAHCVHAGGSCFWEKRLGIETLFWQQTCCSQALERLKPVTNITDHSLLASCTRMEYVIQEVKQPKISTYCSQEKKLPPPILGKPIRFIPVKLFFTAAAAKWTLNHKSYPHQPSYLHWTILSAKKTSL